MSDERQRVRSLHMARNGRKAGFEAGTMITRFDYNLKWDSLTEIGGLVVGEDAEIVLELELNVDI